MDKWCTRSLEESEDWKITQNIEFIDSQVLHHDTYDKCRNAVTPWEIGNVFGTFDSHYLYTVLVEICYKTLKSRTVNLGNLADNCLGYDLQNLEKTKV